MHLYISILDICIFEYIMDGSLRELDSASSVFREDPNRGSYPSQPSLLSLRCNQWQYCRRDFKTMNLIGSARSTKRDRKESC